MQTTQHTNRIFVLGVLTVFLLVSACSMGSTPEPTPTDSFAPELSLYSWVDYMPQSVMDAFTHEYGIKIKYTAYNYQEEAAEQIRAGKVYDLVVLPPELIPSLIAEGHLAKIEYRNVLNFKYVSPSFRDLIFDPNNTYSIPFHWGSTGLLYRTDLVDRKITSWSDLWDPALAGKVAIWPIQRSLIPITLKSLGYPANSEDPAQLKQAAQRLIKLRRNSYLLSNENTTLIPVLAEGQAVLGFGWAYDALLIEDQPINYVIPKEGGLLWSDHFTIPANSPNKRTAELFLDFILRPEISGMIINESYYAMANDAAIPYIEPSILNNPFIYPTQEEIQNSEIILSLSPEGIRLYDEVWQQFMDAGQ